MGQCSAGCAKLICGGGGGSGSPSAPSGGAPKKTASSEQRRPTSHLTNAAFIIENHGKDPRAKYDFEKKNLGEGAYGTVCRGIDKKSKAVRAIKTIAKEAIPDVNRFQAEIDLMKAMDHPNIIKLYETFEDKRKIYLIMEVCEGGEMFDLIVEQGAFKESDVAIIMRQILRAVFYMHKQGVVHRDLKPENFLLDSKGPVANSLIKIIDFGISRCWVEGDKPMTTKAGTPYYVAPEVLAGRYGNEVDVWSCAAIMYILFCGCPPFNGHDDNSILKAVKRGIVTFEEPEWGKVSNAAKEMIKAMLVVDPRNRLTAEKALQHPFLHQSFSASNDLKLPKSMISNLKAFNKVDRFKKAALHVVAQHLSTPQIAKLREVFIKLDENSDGQLTLQEITDGIKKSGGSLTDNFLEVLKAIDSDGSGVIDYTEFLAASIDRKLYCQESACWEAFCIFDRDGDGTITFDELKVALNSVPGDAAIQQTDIDTLMKEYDVNKDGVIDFTEFMAMMQAEEVKRTPIIQSTPGAVRGQNKLLPTIEPTSP